MACISPTAVVHDDNTSSASSPINTRRLTTPDEPFRLGHPDPGPDPSPVDAQIQMWCDRIFEAGFGTLFGLWVGKHGCPMVHNDQGDVCIPPVELFCNLDALTRDMWASQGPSYSSTATAVSNDTTENEMDEIDEMDESLRRATHAYAAPWLLSLCATPRTVITIDADKIAAFVRASWRSTRRDMLRVVNRVSYRSALTLYLFSQTPVPAGIPADEEVDGINGVVCLQSALQQIQQLRLRLRSCQSYGGDLSAWSTGLLQASAPPVTDFHPAFVDLESRVFWAAVTWDTASSVTLEFNTTLTTGLKGACSEPAWVLARAFLVKSFHARTEAWRTTRFELTDAMASEIISAAGICRTYLWRNVASVKEALREGVDDESVAAAWASLHDAVEVFRSTIAPMMAHCEHQLHFLSQTNRLNWYLMVLHHNLGILILVHALEAAARADLLASIHDARLEAEHATLNVLDFGLKSTYTILAGPGMGLAQEISFIGIDPSPDHTLAAVQLTSMAIHRKYRQQTINREVHAKLSHTLLRAVNQLPHGCKSVSTVRQNMLQMAHEINPSVSFG
ncbi:hypothetical protein SCUCBS95973_009859 [Sporothrix curviconia]|uniref:Uncharacterized protein n=1 Tax=Sporothrix curviconia TaxID=1260050 RepID=A0ABP0D011_9PEZI